MKEQRNKWLIALILAVGVGAYNWWSLLHNSYYYPTIALGSPWVTLVLIAYLANPSIAIEPRTKDTALKFWSVIVIGGLLGGLNMFIMSR